MNILSMIDLTIMKKSWIILLLVLFAGCNRGPKPVDGFPTWLQGAWVAINSDEYHTMVVSDSKLGFAASTPELPESVPVKSIEQISSIELVVTPAQTGWKYRFMKSDEFIDVYDIRLKDQREFFHARFKRK